ncbi:MAG: hypothetical protein Sapg2KO_12410 [Saprospiraceae bacterium]
MKRSTQIITQLSFSQAYAWDTDKFIAKAYAQAKSRFAVPFDYADYLGDLYAEGHEMVDTFHFTELGLRTLKKPHSFTSWVS